MTSHTEKDLIPPGTTALFADSRLFRGLGGDALTRLSAIPDVRRYEEGEVIFDEGDTGTDLFLVADGRVAITVRGPGGRQQLLTSLGAGGYFGEMAVLDPAPRSARATAVSRTRLGRVGADALRQMLEVAPLELARNLMIDAIHRLRSVDALLIEETIRAERLSLLGTMTAGIMHDVRNPLSVVSGVAQLLAMQEAGSEQQRWAGMLERAVVAITALVQDVLDYARGTSTITPCDVSAHRLIEDLTELLARRLASRKVELISEVHITQPLHVDRE
ncbi:MAG: cyclic nucleotide-binding domain-containing protein, partial [Longimicrobiales bacterium]